MFLHEIISESVSLDTTIKAIVADIGDPLTIVYQRMKNTCETFAKNNGSLKGVQLILGGIGSQWYQNFYFNRLQNELYDLARFVPNRAAKLRDFLSLNSKSFNEISQLLPEVLAELARQMNNAQLKAACNSWIKMRNEYYDHIDRINQQLGDDEPVEKAPKPKKDNVIGQQQNQVETIVADILRRLPINIAGDIRNAIARSPNKLLALQQELQRRNINL